MGYSKFGKIQQSDWQALVTGETSQPALNLDSPFNALWKDGIISGTTNPSKGYGQPGIPAVLVGDLVKAATTTNPDIQWGQLVDLMDSMDKHISGPSGGTPGFTAISLPMQFTTIRFMQTVVSNLNALSRSRFNASAIGTSANYSAVRNTPWGGTGSGPINSYTTVNFGSDAAARYFFNLGGIVQVSASQTGGSQQNDAWASFLASYIGTLAFTSGNPDNPGGGQTIAGISYTGTTQFATYPTTNPNQSVGFYVLDRNNPEIKIFEALANVGSYGAGDIYRLYASYNGAGVLTLRQEFTAGFMGYPPNQVTGTLTVNATIRPPSTDFLQTNSWGTPVVTVSVPG